MTKGRPPRNRAYELARASRATRAFACSRHAMIARVRSSERDRVMGALSKSQDRVARGREGQEPAGSEQQPAATYPACAAVG